MNNLKLVETTTGKPALLFDNHIYRLKRESKTSNNWRCTKKSCCARLTTDKSNDEILHGDTFHNHDKDEQKTQTNILRQACKRKAAEEISERPRKLLITEAKSMETDKISQSGVLSIKLSMSILSTESQHEEVSLILYYISSFTLPYSF